MNGKWLVITMAATILSSGAARAVDLSPVKIQVNKHDKVANLALAPRAARPNHAMRDTRRTEEETLEITLSNSSSKAYESLTVKYYVFSETERTHEFSVESSGEKTIPLAALGRATFETEKQSAEFREGRKGTSLGGYAVRVLNGSTLVAELFEPPSLKDKPELLVEKQKKKRIQ